MKLDGVPHLLFFKRLNPNSNYPPAYEVCVYPLDQLLARQRQLRWQILGAGGLLLLGGFVVSHFFSRRLSRPVEELAVVSEENLAQRQRAEAKLQTTAEELQRSARFSADASHQLKSPITVLRAGLDSLLARDGFPREVYEEISSLIHQTYRLTGVVEDLLLLSRMDAGKLRLNLHTVDLAHLVEEWIDDLRAMPEAADLRVENHIPDNLQISGETKFTSLVVQTSLDNARKYNRRGGSDPDQYARETGKQVELRVANTGRGIPAEEQPYIFERFHRAGAGDEVPGHGLGLNLARELVRLHGGELRLRSVRWEWTEFSALFARPWPPLIPPDRVMKPAFICACLLARHARKLGAEDFFDEVDQALTISLFDDQVRARVSGLLDLEYYHYPQPPPGLIRAGGHDLLQPAAELFSRCAGRA